ncbi:MAG TPA: hypothetical protein VNA25_07875 [Phycisphaerae bacterium]|nr:hypothetical protein [Phycisphaerae bacterium]
MTKALAILCLLASVIQAQTLTVSPDPAVSGEFVTAHLYWQQNRVVFIVLDVQIERPSETEAVVGVLVARDYDQPDGLLYLIPGDANYDGRVDLVDLITLARNWGGPPSCWPMGDFDTNKIVDLADLVLLARNWGNWYCPLDLYVGLGDDFPHGINSVTFMVYEGAGLLTSLTTDFNVAPEPTMFWLLTMGIPFGRRVPGRRSRQDDTPSSLPVIAHTGPERGG